MSFYKKDETTNEILEAPNFVYSPDFVLLAEDVDEYIQLGILPMDGWYWFDSNNEAKTFFNS